MLWFAPLWLVSILPVLEDISESRTGRNLGFVMLALSIFTVSTALESPWQHPWIYRLMQFFGLD